MNLRQILLYTESVFYRFKALRKMLRNIRRQFCNGLFMTVQHVFSVFNFADVQLRNGKCFFYKRSSFFPFSKASPFSVVISILLKGAKSSGFKSRTGNNFFPLFFTCSNLILNTFMYLFSTYAQIHEI